MTVTAPIRRVRIYSPDGKDSVPALLIRIDEWTVAIEAHPSRYGRHSPLHGRSRIYFLGGDIRFDEIDEVEVDGECIAQAREYVHLVNALEALASPFGELPEAL